MDSSIELAEFFFFTIFIKMVALQWIALQCPLRYFFRNFENLQSSSRSFTSPWRLHFTIVLRVDGLAWNRLSFSLLHCGILVITLRILFSGAKSAQGKVLSKASSLIPSLEIKFSDLKEILDFGFFSILNFFSKFQILKCLKMSNDRNSRLYHARDSVYGRNSTYGRSSVQSGNDGLTGRSSMSPGRTSNRLSPVPDRKSTSQRTSNVSNPPSTNSHNRKRYFYRGLLELLWFLKNLKS